MIFIVVKFETNPEWTDRWPELVAAFTAATRAEEGNLWFEW
jgi:quinol monooxygenase YgiN